ncbi:MAG: hypothetical protein H6622_05595 [Halobacteriovoraceae bacterium]|nr:hypothetical protein [Halobacteriovoraceae bacterium]
MKNFIIFLFLFAVYQNISHAALFSNQYCQFELPPGWECSLEGGEYVCQSVNKDRQKEAIIVLAAKLRGKQDNLQDYEAYLKQPKTFKLPGGKEVKSDYKYAKMKEINGHNWIDSLHLASEVPGFYTRYLATVKEDLGVAFTFSVSKDHYEAYKAIIDALVQSLRVFRQTKSQNWKPIAVEGEGKKFNANDTTIIPDGEQVAVQRDPNKGPGIFGLGENETMILAIVGAVAAFIVLKKLKKK